MPSFFGNHHSRSHTWPPGIHLIDFSFIKPPSDEESLVNIDDDPFSHFISPLTEDDDPYDGLSLSAGILTPESPPSSPSQRIRDSVAKRWARYLGRSQSDLSESYTTAKSSYNSSGFSSWEDLSDNEDNNDTKSQYSSRKHVVREPTRGRAQDLVGPIDIRGRGTRATRTLSGHRHSWQQPSAELFTVLEEADTYDNCNHDMESADELEVVKETGLRPSIRRKAPFYEKAKL